MALPNAAHVLVASCFTGLFDACSFQAKIHRASARERLGFSPFVAFDCLCARFMSVVVAMFHQLHTELLP
jgi:hypothetical protein